MTLAGVVHVRPEGAEAETDRTTVPVKLFTAVRVMLEVPEEPTRICDGETAPALIVKSGISATWNVISAVVWERVLLAPVTVTTKSLVPGELQDRVAVSGEVPNVTFDARVQVKPEGVGADTDRLTVPVKPFSAVRLIVWVIMLLGEPLMVTGEEGATI